MDGRKRRGGSGGTAGRRSWAAAGAVSLLAHALALTPLLAARVAPLETSTPEPERPPVVVTLAPPPPVRPETPAPEPAPAEAAAGASSADPAEAEAPPAPSVPRPRPAPRADAPPVRRAAAAAPALALTPMRSLGEGELAGALRAGSGAGAGSGNGAGAGAGAGGGACDMVGRLEAALAGDPGLAAAVARAPGAAGRALLVWDGDWVRSPDQAGRGLAGVRQAIAVEIAFAPRACRDQRVRGYAVIALAEGAGAPRLALGGGSWRWSDLAGAR